MDAVQPNSPDVFQTPAWLTIEFLQDILRSHRKQQSLLVNSFTVKPAVAEGENYSSNVLRLGIKLTAAGTDAPQPEDVSLIVKIRLIDDKAPAVIEDMNCFGIETDAYFMVLPRVHWMLHLIGDYTQLAPKLVFVYIMYVIGLNCVASFLDALRPINELGTWCSRICPPTDTTWLSGAKASKCHIFD